MPFGHQFSDNTAKFPRRRQLVVGTRKVLFDSDVPGCCVLQFKETDKDNPDKIYSLSSQASINNRFSEMMMTYLSDLNINTHLIRRINLIEQLVYACEVIPIRMSVYNSITPDLAERMSIIPETFSLEEPLVEFCLKTERRDYPCVSDDHIHTFDLTTEDELEEIRAIGLRVNDVLYGFFLAHGFRLSRVHLEFGRTISDGEYGEPTDIIIIDEISFNTIILQDIQTAEYLDASMGQVFSLIARRLGLFSDGEAS